MRVFVYTTAFIQRMQALFAPVSVFVYVYIVFLHSLLSLYIYLPSLSIFTHHISSSHSDVSVCQVVGPLNGYLQSAQDTNLTINVRYPQGVSVSIICFNNFVAINKTTTATCNDSGVWSPSLPGCDGECEPSLCCYSTECSVVTVLLGDCCLHLVSYFFFAVLLLNFFYAVAYTQQLPVLLCLMCRMDRLAVKTYSPELWLSTPVTLITTWLGPLAYTVAQEVSGAMLLPLVN